MNDQWKNMYEEKFDSDQYLKEKYLDPTLAYQEAELFRDEVVLTHEVLSKTGGFGGKDLIELGCGPSIAFNIVPSQYFDNVYLSDYLEKNRQALKDWLYKKPRAHDFQPFFNLAGKLMGKSSPWGEGPEILRKKICGVLSCDVSKQEVLPPSEQPRHFDCVSSCLLLDSICSTDEELNTAIKHMSNLLKKDGILLILTTFNTGDLGYTIKDQRFVLGNITEENLGNAIQKADLQLIKKQIKRFDETYQDCLYAYGIFMATKR